MLRNRYMYKGFTDLYLVVVPKHSKQIDKDIAMIKKFINTALVVFFTGMVSVAQAAIIAQSETEEVESVNVIMLGKNIHKLQLVGCERCPIELNVSDETVYKKGGKVVPLKKVKSMSGSPGTVIYDGKESLVTEVIW